MIGPFTTLTPDLDMYSSVETLVDRVDDFLTQFEERHLCDCERWLKPGEECPVCFCVVCGTEKTTWDRQFHRSHPYHFTSTSPCEKCCLKEERERQ